MQASPGRRPSPVPRRPPSSERWQHDGAAADATAAAARITPPQPAADSQRRQQQSSAARLASANAQQPQSAVQKAAAVVPEPVVVAEAGSPRRQDGTQGSAHGSRRKELQADAGRRGDPREDSRQEKKDSRRSGGHGKKDLARDGGVAAEGRRSASPAERRQKSPRGEAMAAAGSRWTLLSRLACVSVWCKVVRQLLIQGRPRKTAMQTNCWVGLWNLGLWWTGCAMCMSSCARIWCFGGGQHPRVSGGTTGGCWLI